MLSDVPSGEMRQLAEEVQFTTGLGDDSFGLTAGGHLLVENSWSGSLSRADREAAVEAARRFGWSATTRDGAVILRPPGEP
jgi:hypothetical protein